jgi:mannan endo-1,4-beta-mannosidase
VSQGVGSGKKRRRSFLTSKDVLARFRRSDKKARSLVETDSSKKIRVRGGWTAPPTSANTFSRRGGSLGPAYDGSHGVDSEDICNDPNIDFCNFQLFPDQDFYGVFGGKTTHGKRQNSDSSSGFTSDSVAQSINFILNQADSSKSSGKPVLNSATGITSTSQANTLNNFDSSNIGPQTGQTFASNSEQSQAYSSITAASANAGINGILSYQHGATGESSVKGSIVDNSDSSSKRDLSGLGRTPNDGYAIYPNSNNSAIWNALNQQQSSGS